MNRYIDADALMQDVIAHSYPLTNAFSVGGVDDGMFVKGIQQVVDEQPTVDAVPVCRCRECKHLTEITDYNGWCPRINDHIENFDWFCADGERGTDGKQ